MTSLIFHMKIHEKSYEFSHLKLVFLLAIRWMGCGNWKVEWKDQMALKYVKKMCRIFKFPLLLNLFGKVIKVFSHTLFCQWLMHIQGWLFWKDNINIIDANRQKTFSMGQLGHGPHQSQRRLEGWSHHSNRKKNLARGCFLSLSILQNRSILAF